MQEAEKKIRSYIRPGKAARVILVVTFLLTAVLLLGGTVLKLNKNKATAEKFDSLTSPKETFSYIDVVAVSDWCYEYTYNSAKNTFYVVEDTDGYWSFATIGDDDIARMRAQRLYWDGKTDVAPAPYRITGEAWPLNASTRTWSELYKVSGLESAEEFEKYFGTMYLLNGYNPIEEAGSGLYLAAIFIGLFWAIMMMCCLPTMIKTAKSIGFLKKNGSLEAAAEELRNCPAIGPCVIGEQFFFASRKGVVIPVSDIVSCSALPNAVRMKTESFGEVIVPDLKAGMSREIMDALPLKNETVTVKHR